MNRSESIEETVERIKRLGESVRVRQEEFIKKLDTQPRSKPCPQHPGGSSDLDHEGSVAVGEVRYVPCRLCVEERAEFEMRARLRQQGVPSILLDCKLDTWDAWSPNLEERLKDVREFVAKRVGFLVLLGSVGTGKSHLAVGAMRHFKTALFRKQSTLLRELRRTYQDKTAEDPVDKCQGTELLVLDEVGLSSGGRDEMPMLHEILDCRHGERLPTILTSNLTWDGLKEVLGPRLHDRLCQSAFRVLSLGEASRRKQARGRYFGEN
jgi:DNA replication protein DnaC